MDESGLIAAAREGNAEAFGDLIRLYDAAALRLALRLLRSEDEARDVYQEAFLRAWRSIRDFRGECAFRTWLYRIVTNACLDHARRRSGRHGGPPQETGAAGDDEWAVEAARLLVDRRPDNDPERVLADREVRRRVAEALGRLPERERLVFELRHDQELRVAEVAEILATTEETVRNCLYRAHQRLRVALGDLRAAPGAAPERPRRSLAREARVAGRGEPVEGVE